MAKEKWNEQFQTNKHTYGKSPNVFIRENSGLFPPNSSIACFAEGEGRNAVYLATLGHDVTAYDYSSVGLHHATLLAKENHVAIKTTEVDLTEVKVEKNKYDGAVMVFGHVIQDKQEAFLTNMIEAVKPGGYFLFEIYSKKQITFQTGGPNDVDMLYDPVDILNWI